MLFLYITVMYTLEGVFIAGQTNYQQALNEQNISERSKLFDDNEISHPENYTYEEMQVKTNPLDIVIGFLGFAPLGLPPALQTIIVTSIAICFIVLGMLVYVFIRDWIPLI